MSRDNDQTVEFNQNVWLAGFAVLWILFGAWLLRDLWTGARAARTKRLIRSYGCGDPSCTECESSRRSWQTTFRRRR